MVRGENSEFFQAAFAKFPSIVFVVDSDVSIHEYNEAAANLLKAERDAILKRRAGDLLHCIHAHEKLDACGRMPFCDDCLVRSAVNISFASGEVVRRRTRLELIQDGAKQSLYALITTTPLQVGGESLALLIIEDIGELAELHRLIPICAGCKKVRDDQQSWQVVEAYFKHHWDLDFTHGFCPDCLDKQIELSDTLLEEN